MIAAIRSTTSRVRFATRSNRFPTSRVRYADHFAALPSAGVSDRGTESIRSSDPIDWVADRMREVGNYIRAIPDRFRDERAASGLRGPLPRVRSPIAFARSRTISSRSSIAFVWLRTIFEVCGIPAVRIANHLQLGVSVMTMTSNEVLHSLSWGTERMSAGASDARRRDAGGAGHR